MNESDYLKISIPKQKARIGHLFSKAPIGRYVDLCVRGSAKELRDRKRGSVSSWILHVGCQLAPHLN